MRAWACFYIGIALAAFLTLLPYLLMVRHEVRSLGQF